MSINLNVKCDKFIKETMELNDLAAIAIGVSIGGEEYVKVMQNPRFQDGDPKKLKASEPVPMSEDTVFHCASVSKTFTATAIMKLVEAGVLNLYDRLVNLIPEFFDTDIASGDEKLCINDWRFKEIRLWNLLSHTSGLGDVDDYHWDEAVTNEDALAKYILESPEVINQPMLWAPQSAPEFYGQVTDEDGKASNLFRYSNIAYEILGYIVSKYSNRINAKSKSALDDKMDGSAPISYEDFIDKNIFKALGMNSSTMKTFERCAYNSSSERKKNNMADPYMKAENRSIVPVEYYPYTRYHAPSSTLTSTLGDLLKWGRAHLKCSREIVETGVLQKESYDSIWRDYATVPNNGEKMGLGWFMRKQKVPMLQGKSGKVEYTLYGHEGSDDGFRASFWICPELDMVTVVLANLSNAPVKRINKQLFEVITKEF